VIKCAEGNLEDPKEILKQVSDSYLVPGTKVYNNKEGNGST
jgi:hypothetical protein